MKDLLSVRNPCLIVLMVYGHQPSASTQTMPAASGIARDLKAFDKNIPIAMGGTHPSALPERTLSDEPVDYIIQGEGPSTISGLVDYLRGKKELHDVPGLWHKKNGAPELTQKSGLVQDLDGELGRYAWDLLPPVENYRAHTWHCFEYFKDSKDPNFADVRSPYVSLYTSLGCPYSCNFCCINAIFGKPGIRYWSVERVIDWIGELVEKHHVRNIRFADELFVLSSKRVNQFCDMIIERGYDLNIWAYGRVDTINHRLLSKMKRAGINWLCLGIESGNPEVRKSVNKSIKKDISEVVREIKDAGVYMMGNYMFGLPEDSIDTMEQTLELAMSLNCEFANFYVTMAYPGSSLFDESYKKGWTPKSWTAYSQHNYETQPLPTRFLTPAQVLKFRDEAFVRYFKNPAYLKMIETTFGTITKEHIEEMLRITIKRRLTSLDSNGV